MKKIISLNDFKKNRGVPLVKEKTCTDVYVVDYEIQIFIHEGRPFTGVSVQYYDHKNEKKMSELCCKNGKAHGLWTWWYKNGQKKFEAYYKDGQETGLYTHWHRNGQKQYEGYYKNGQANGLHTGWHKNGQKQGEVHYKDGKENGRLTTWFEIGQKWYEYYYKDGELDGPSARWYKNGQKEDEVHYKDGNEEKVSWGDHKYENRPLSQLRALASFIGIACLSFFVTLEVVIPLCNLVVGVVTEVTLKITFG